ncbi:MAG: hypothetical protein EB059_11130 [Alphaproteobacteria bacterium]|nr:hypothetical protein [Alphaproteobacteria bacterium]
MNLAGSEVYLSHFGLNHGASTQQQAATEPVRPRDQLSHWWIKPAPANDDPPAAVHEGMIISDQPRSPFAGQQTLRERQMAAALLKLAA